MPQPTNSTNQLDLHKNLHNALNVDVASVFGTTAANIVSAVAVAAANPGTRLYFGPYTWTITTADLSYTDIGLGTFWTNSGFLARLPSNTTLYGPGIIQINGVPAEGLVPPYTNHYAVFAMGGGESHIRIEGLTFQGQNSPFVFYSGNQAAPIRVYADSAVSDIEIIGCTFKNLYGFPVQAEGNPHPSRVNVRGCTIQNVGNTINNNADYGVIERNTFTTSGGVEASGIAVRVSDNTFYDTRTSAVSVGGNTAADSVGLIRGVRVTGNTINTCTASGIIVADGIRGALIDGNTITRCHTQAIGFTVSSGYNPTDCMISNNHIYGNNEVGSGTTSAVTLGTGGSHSFIGNTLWDDDTTASYWQQHGLDVYGTDCVVANNYIESVSSLGTAKCVSVGAVANVYLGPNVYVGAKTVEIGGSSTVGATDLYGRVVGDRVLRTRISNGSVGVARYDLFADGAMAWGDGSGATDTTLYRTAANQLKSDDTIQAVDGVATKVKAGTPVDGDFATTPPIGTIVVDTTANKIWVRTAAATWKGVVVA